MEWAVLVLFVLLATLLIGAPPLRSREAGSPPVELDALLDEHRLLLAELRELAEDAASGRISAADRQEGRRALAPRLRAVTEALRPLDEPVSRRPPEEGQA